MPRWNENHHPDFAETYPKQSWTASELRLLKTMWGYHPISAIAKRLGRTATAVDVT